MNLSSYLKPWNVFIVSYIISRAIIWFLADYLKIRLLRPLKEARAKRALLTEKLGSKEETDNLEDFPRMNYGQLREMSKDSKRIDSMSDDAFRSFALNYTYQVQKRIIHIHHFILGIPLMPLTWILFFYQVAWGQLLDLTVSWGMVAAGATFALFMSEFYQLLTQEWGL